MESQQFVRFTFKTLHFILAVQDQKYMLLGMLRCHKNNFICCLLTKRVFVKTALALPPLREQRTINLLLLDMLDMYRGITLSPVLSK